jgi:hypothetical protein
LQSHFISMPPPAHYTMLVIPDYYTIYGLHIQYFVASKPVHT